MKNIFTPRDKKEIAECTLSTLSIHNERSKPIATYIRDEKYTTQNVLKDLKLKIMNMPRKTKTFEESFFGPDVDDDDNLIKQKLKEKENQTVSRQLRLNKSKSQHTLNLSKSKNNTLDYSNRTGKTYLRRSQSRINNSTLDYSEFSAFNSSSKLNRGYGMMSEVQSASTLQHSIPSFSFGISKASRFAKHNDTSNDLLYDIPTQKRNNAFRNITQGIGTRKGLLDQSNNYPCPGHYQLKSNIEQGLLEKKGYTISKRLNPPKVLSYDQPGPGEYQVDKGSWKKNQPITLRSRISFFYEQDMKNKQDTISPQKYNPNTDLDKLTRYKDISFGVGERSSSLLKRNDSMPGPGTYNLPEIFKVNRTGTRGKLPLN